LFRSASAPSLKRFVTSSSESEEVSVRLHPGSLQRVQQSASSLPPMRISCAQNP
jgi:hypothetical protein